MWLYGSGFPKSMNIGLQLDKKEGLQGQRGIGGFNVGGIQEQQNRKAKLYIGSTTDGSKQKAYTDYKGNMAKKWKGWGSCLKPAFEPIIVARKPFKGSLVDNVIKWGVGGLNIDECRVGNEIIKGGTTPDFRDVGQKSKEAIGIDKLNFGQVENAKRKPLDDHIGRFPANLILTYNQLTFDDVCGGFPETQSNKNKTNHKDEYSACRYFYCAKASKKDRDEGLDDFEEDKVNDGRLTPIDNPFQRGETPRRNIHPTVKPTSLMQYLIRLVTPNGGVILDPFMGSGSTGKAVIYENRERNKNYDFIGIEKEEEYYKIAKARIENI